MKKAILFFAAAIFAGGLLGCAGSAASGDAKYYKYKDSNVTRAAAVAMCKSWSYRATLQDFYLMPFTRPEAFKTCMSEAGFLLCSEGGENLPECQ